MSSRRLSSSLPMRTVMRTAAIASERRSEPLRVKHVNHSTTNFATLDDSVIKSAAQVLSPRTLAPAKSLSHQIQSSMPPSASLPRPADVFVKVFEEDRKLDKLSKTFVFGEKHGKITRAWEPVEKEMWLERFGGPGKTMERVAGKGSVVLRDAGADGKGYLRVLI